MAKLKGKKKKKFPDSESRATNDFFYVTLSRLTMHKGYTYLAFNNRLISSGRYNEAVYTVYCVMCPVCTIYN